MTIQAFGINHKTASIALREKLSLHGTRLNETLSSLHAHGSEAAILSTCNRTEIYTIAEEQPKLHEWLANQHQLNLEVLHQASYYHQDLHAVKHLIRVASGLDSMLLGEPQIFGQMKQAYKLAYNAGTLGSQLDFLFQSVFSACKEIRHETQLGAHPVSLAYIATKLAKQLFSQLSQQRVLFIGAGDTIELIATHLKNSGVQHIHIANRTIEKGEQLAKAIGGTAICIGDISAQLAQTDIIISATASQLPILGKGAIERAFKRRKHRPMLLIDLAVPRDIEPEIAELPDAYLYNIDDLQSLAQQNEASRQAAVEQAETLVDIKALHYMQTLRINETAQTINHYRKHMKQLSAQELAKALKRLEQGEASDTVLVQLADALTNKFMHKPTIKIREAAFHGNMAQLAYLKELITP